PWGVFGLTMTLLVLALILSVERGLGWDPLGWLQVTIGFAGVGALVAQRTRNRVGWLFLAFGLSVAVSLGLKAYATRATGPSLPGASWVGWAFTILIEAEFPLFLLALLIFPSGRLPSARWRPVAGA